MSKFHGLEYLLGLDGEVLAQDGGCWIKIKARKLVHKTAECPHGIKYCLTLHNQYGKRLLGFDNAHLIKTKEKGRFVGRSIVYDHKHLGPGDIGVPYVFESAEQLLIDFFAEVDKVLKSIE